MSWRWRVLAWLCIVGLLVTFVVGCGLALGGPLILARVLLGE